MVLSGLARTAPLAFLAGFVALASQAPVIAEQTETAPSAEVAASPAAELLVFDNGDRIRGRLLRQDGQLLVFQSDNLGELRASVLVAHVEVAPPLETVPVHAAVLPTVGQPADQKDGEPKTSTPAAVVVTPWWRSPAALTNGVSNFLGPWEGRLAMALSLTEDTRRGENWGVDLTFSRKWTRDQARFELHYYFAKSDGDVQTDLLKGSGIIRHDFEGPYFVSYRPSVEWNRNHFIAGEPADYVLAQHSLGAGFTLLDRPTHSLRVGLAENVFDLWTLEDDQHSTRDAQSLFGELELELPWRIRVSARGTWYYDASTGDTGWEDEFELVKKFSDTLSLGLRRQARENHPDDRIADYSLLRFQVGLDF